MMDGAALWQTMGTLHPVLWGHSQAVTEMVSALADHLELASDERCILEDAARFHDIGKLEIDRAIQDKPGPLDAEEWEIMRLHAGRGAAFLEASPELCGAAPAVRHHHERYDGAGYPDRLTANEIPLLARLLCLADSYHAMTTVRPYRAARTDDEAREELRRCSGSQFDPELVEIFLRSLEARTR